MKARLGWAVALACGVVCAAEPARAPMDWKSVHPEAIAAWKTANNAPDGVVADAASHTVRFLVEATGLAPAEPAEFFAIGLHIFIWFEHRSWSSLSFLQEYIIMYFRF